MVNQVGQLSADGCRKRGPIQLAWMVNQVGQLSADGCRKRDPIQLAWMVNQVGQLSADGCRKRDPIQLAWMVNQVGQLERTAMSLDPLYRSENLRPAFQLRYSWTGWLKSAWTEISDSSILDTVDPLWEEDGMRRLEHLWADDHLQITFTR